MKIASVIGTRPQFIKASAINRVIRNFNTVEEIIIHTGHHYDSNLSDIFFSELKLPDPIINLGVGPNMPGKQTARILESLEEVFEYERPDWVLVYGDSNSSLAGALAAVKLQIPVAHIEAGLRCFNRKNPLEVNRCAIDQLCDVLFAPTLNALQNLKNEGLADKAVFSGDVMYDTFLNNIKKAEEINSKNISSVKPGNYYLATIHLPENTNDFGHLQRIFMALSELDFPVIVPLHPRSLKYIDEITYRSNIQIVQPVGYLEMLHLVSNCIKVITDSGGLQKEAYFMSKPCITLRNETEWIETLQGNWNILCNENWIDWQDFISETNFGIQHKYFGNGNAAQTILNYLVFGNSQPIIPHVENKYLVKN